MIRRNWQRFQERNLGAHARLSGSQESRPPGYGFRLGPLAPAHRAVVDGDTKSAAIAAASIIAKVTRDRVMRRLDALYPRYGFARHVGYITPGHSAAVREHGPSDQHRLSFNALAYASQL